MTAHAIKSHGGGERVFHICRLDLYQLLTRTNKSVDILHCSYCLSRMPYSICHHSNSSHDKLGADGELESIYGSSTFILGRSYLLRVVLTLQTIHESLNFPLPQDALYHLISLKLLPILRLKTLVARHFWNRVGKVAEWGLNCIYLLTVFVILSNFKRVPPLYYLRKPSECQQFLWLMVCQSMCLIWLSSLTWQG